MARGYNFSLWQDGIKVAGAYSLDYDQARREIEHYAMVYGQDGPVKIRGPKKPTDEQDVGK